MTTSALATTMFLKKDWEPNRHHGIRRRVASLLDWYANQRPSAFLSFPEIARRVLRLKTPLGSRSRLTTAIQDDIYRCRDLLANLFGRDVITNGRGARATVDADELFRFRLGLDLTRVVSQLSRYGRTARLISSQGTDNPKLSAHANDAEAFALNWAEPLRALLADWSATVGLEPGELRGYLDA
jgi:hypothetical protein